MKYLAIAAAVLCLTACATPAPIAPVTLVSVHESPTLGKQQICNMARDWAALNFKDSKSVVEVFDPEQGKLIGKGRFPIAYMGSSPMNAEFVLVVECRDGRLRATYDDVHLTHQGTAFPMTDNAVLGNPRRQADAKLKSLDQSLSEYLKNPKFNEKW